jgi:hypothetical protein
MDFATLSAARQSSRPLTSEGGGVDRVHRIPRPDVHLGDQAVDSRIHAVLNLNECSYNSMSVLIIRA